jgi:hypothetical protein
MMDKIISFILCSRNDNYMGNPVGRLEIALNYLAENVRLLGMEESVEVIVTDWGSETPLRKVLNLNATASIITRFLEVPISVAKEVQKDSPFAEVLALNAAVRHAGGQYIGRIDQDTLVGKRFLRMFFEWIDGKRNPPVNLEKSYLFSCRREIPFAFASRNPSLDQVSRLIRWCGSMLAIEMYYRHFFVGNPVGIMLLHRNIWEECGGYDERLIYWGWMEVDMAYRVQNKYPLVNLGRMVGTDFYHLEHYDPSLPRKTPRNENPKITEGLSLSPNKSTWGLINYPLILQSYSGDKVENPEGNPRHSTEWSDVLFVPATTVKVVCAYVPRSIKSAINLAYIGLKQPARYGEFFKRIFKRIF